MSNIIITYETLYEFLTKEKTRKELQKLNPEFFQHVNNYLEEKKLILESQKKSNIFTKETEKTEKQIKNIKKIIEQLHERRERKIIETAIIASRSKIASQQLSINMLPKEKEFYKNLIETINQNKTEILSNLLNTQKTKTLKSKKNQNLNILIRFLEAIPKFIGTDDIIYGPFEKEDIANLPSNIANIIIKKNRAEKIET